MKNSDDGVMLQEYRHCQEVVDKRLAEFFTGHEDCAELDESMRYSLLAGGKRIRAAICLKFCEAVGSAEEKAIDAACAIEMLHAYSLIHDDLPCMDDDDMRRGKPSNHIRFGESTAMLAGDALQASAFETLLSSDLPADSVVEMARILANAAGPRGICGGQYLDLAGEGKLLTQGELEEIHKMKTAALISASARLGVIAAGGTQEQIAAAEGYAHAVGLAFQIRDDLLDCISTTDELGKPAGSDSGNDKATFATILGVDECENLVRYWTNRAIEALGDKFVNTGFLAWLAQMLAERKN